MLRDWYNKQGKDTIKEEKEHIHPKFSLFIILPSVKTSFNNFKTQFLYCF